MRLLLSLLVLLSGCATTISLPVATGAATAKIQNYMDRSREGANWRLQILRLVDNQPVPYALVTDGRDDTVQVEAGARRLVVYAMFNLGFGSGGPYEAIVLVPVVLEAGRTYRILGDVRDNHYHVWLADPLTGEKLSAEYSAAYNVKAQTQSIPIFIPVR